LDKIAGILLTALLVIVIAVSLSYYVLSQPNQTENNTLPTPTLTAAPSPSPSEIPTEPISIPKPSVPEFTVEYVNNSYYAPPIYGIDEYSGETVQTGGGFTVANKSIELTIKNQPFIHYVLKDENGTHDVYLRYQIGYKGHFGEEWHYITETVYDSSSDYTIILFGVDWDRSNDGVVLQHLSSGDKMDFQVQARIGYIELKYDLSAGSYLPGGYPSYQVFHGTESGWSGTQTITIP
jgi:hypothetical protein